MTETTDRRSARTSNEKTENIENQWSALFTFTSRSQLILLVPALVIGITSGGIVPSFAFLLGRIFDEFAKFGGGSLRPGEFEDSVKSYIQYLVILGSVGVLLNAVFLLLWMTFGEIQACLAREQLFDCIADKPISWFDTQPSGVGATLQKFLKQIREVQSAVSQPLGFLVQYLVTCVAALCLAFASSWDLTLVCLATIPVALMALAFISGKLQPAMEAQTECLTAATRQVKSMVEAIDVVKSFNAQYEEATKYLVTIESAGTHYLTQARWNAIQIGFVRLLTRTLFVQGFWYGSHLVRQGNRTSGQVLTAFWGCLMATQTFEQILPQLMVLERGRSAASSIGKFIRGRAPPGSKGSGQGYVPDQCGGHIQFRNVTFAYPARSERLSLMSVSLDFAAGKTTYVVGRSGSGKSTLTSLLLGFYTDLQGQITIDGNPLDLLDVEWLRQNVAILSQDSVLFNETFLKNIAFGRSSTEAIRRTLLDESIKVASLSDVIRLLPEGLHTLLGTGGTSLSGGQAQRVTIARARVKDSPVLILDEATSALDPATGKRVMEEILRWRKGRTTIIITHDIAQVGQDDYLYVLDMGRVVEKGYRHSLETETPTSPFAELVKAAGPRGVEVGLGSRTFGQDIADRRPFNLPPDPSATPFRARKIGRKKSTTASVSHASSSGSTFRRPSVHFGGPAFSMAVSQLSTARISMAAPTLRDDTTSLTALSDEEPTSPLINVAGEIARYRRARSSWSERPSSAVEADIEMDLQRPAGKNRSSEIILNAQEAVDRKAEDPALPVARILRTVWIRLGTKLKVYCCLGFLAAAVHATCTPLFSWIFAQLLASYYTPEDGGEKALRLSLSLLGISVADAIASCLTHYLLEYTAQAWIDDIRFDAMRRILDQPMVWFESEEARVSDLVEQLNRGAEEMRSLLGRFAGHIFVAVIMMLVGLVWCLVESWKLTLVGVSTAPAMYALTAGFDKVTAVWESKCNRAYQVASDILSDTAGKVQTVRAFCLQPYFYSKHGVASRKALGIGVRRAALCSVFFGFSDGCIFFIVALTFWYGSRIVSSGEYDVSSILTVFSMLLFVISSVNAIIAFMPQLSSARAVATRLLKLTQLSSLNNHEHLGDTRVTELPGSVWCRDLRFAYPSRPNRYALDGVTFEIVKNSSTALVGASGSGKSTIIGLLLRLHSLSGSTNSGSLKVGNIPLAQLDVNSWRSTVAYIPQKASILPGTFSDNIAYGLPSHSPYRNAGLIRNAAVIAGLNDFICSLPDGFDTVIGDGGMGLSGGQRQKLGIARALIRRPRLLVLDEPTSALDASSAEDVRKLLKHLVELDRLTVLVVTHNVEMMRAMERVVVLDKGRVVEQGRFGDVLAQGGELARLVGFDTSRGRFSRPR